MLPDWRWSLSWQATSTGCTLTVSKKIEVVDWHRASGGNVSRTSRHFKIDRKRIREWDSKYETLKQLNYGKQKMKRKFTNAVSVFSEEVDFER